MGIMLKPPGPWPLPHHNTPTGILLRVPLPPALPSSHLQEGEAELHTGGEDLGLAVDLSHHLVLLNDLVGAVGDT